MHPYKYLTHSLDNILIFRIVLFVGSMKLLVTCCRSIYTLKVGQPGRAT
jgi:hypothetical protein